MVTINIIERPDPVIFAPYQRFFFELLGETERISIERTRKEKDKIEKMLGWVLTRMEAAYRYHVHPAAVRIAFHEKGKPYFPDFYDFKFNITHGGSIIAVAFCNNYEVGIDVEATDRKVNLMIAERYFTQSESEFLEIMPEQQRSHTFLRLWTIKEAYLKMTGDGLSKPLNSFEIKHDGNEIKIYENEILQNCTVFQDETDPKHFITICVKGNENNFTVKRLYLKDIIKPPSILN